MAMTGMPKWVWSRAIRALPTPEPGSDPRVGDLNGAAHPLLPAGGQGVHGNEAGGGGVFSTTAPQDFPALHAGAPGDPGGQGGHRAQSAEVLRQFRHQVAGDQEKLGAARADGVRGHLAVAQAGHQNRPGFGQDRQGLQGRRHRPGSPKGLLPVLGQLGQVQGEVGPLGFSRAASPAWSRISTRVRGSAKEGVLLGLYPGKAGGFLGGTLCHQRRLMHVFKQGVCCATSVQ